ncbi:MAG: glycosyltransferase [Alphaproteobacteria bacterium]|nr:glycosyltransferase [Alphaproteobacteria bacterium]
MRRRRHLIIFARTARLGAVKTRLAASIGAGEAWRFHRRTMQLLIHCLAQNERWQTWLALPGGQGATDRTLPFRLPIIDQGHGDIGRRMARAFEALPPGPAVLVGVDIPALRPHHIEAAFQALGQAEVVFGPASDGGYWLIGLSRSRRALDPFSGVRWSSPHTLQDSRATLPTDARIATIATLDDIDDGAAYARWRLTRR